MNPLLILLGGSGGGFFSNGSDENADGGRGFLQGGVGGKGNRLKANGGFGEEEELTEEGVVVGIPAEVAEVAER